jgi:ABC-type bacteriocin/lantibiotic exporter with double-glycine peptidase domain
VNLLGPLGIDAPSDVVRRWEAVFAESTASMADLRDEARELGAELKGIRCTTAELAHVRGPAILHLADPDHFIVFLNQSAALPQVIDQSRFLDDPEQVGPRLERFTGKALILDQARSAGGPRVQADMPAVTAEPSAPGKPILARFSLTNSGWT